MDENWKGRERRNGGRKVGKKREEGACPTNEKIVPAPQEFEDENRDSVDKK